MIKVIIERHIADSLTTHYDALLRKTMQHIINVPGFISSEPLVDLKHPQHRYVITCWNSMKAWQQWEISPTRRGLLSEITPMLESDEKITILTHAHSL